MTARTPLVRADDFDAVLFDLDGVLTTTRALARGGVEAHVRRVPGATGTPGTARRTDPFDEHADYAALRRRQAAPGRRAGLPAPRAGSSCPRASRTTRPSEESVWGAGQPQAAARRGGAASVPASRSSRARSRGCGSCARPGSRPPSCRAAATAPPSSTTRGSPTCSTPASTATPRSSSACPASRRPTCSSRRPGGSASPRRAAWWSRTRWPGSRPAGRERSGWSSASTGTATPPSSPRTAPTSWSPIWASCWPRPTERRHRAGPRDAPAGGRGAADHRRDGRLPRRSVAAGRERLQPRLRRADRDAVRAVQRVPRHPRRPSRRASPRTSPATLLNGFHETWPIVYPETRVRLRHDRPDDPAGSGRHDDPPARRRGSGHLRDDRGPRASSARWTCGGACSTAPSCTSWRTAVACGCDTTRFVSLAQRHMACIRYEVTALDAPSRLVISSELVTPAPSRGGDRRTIRGGAAPSPATSCSPTSSASTAARVIRTYRTARSGLAVAAGIDHDFDAPTHDARPHRPRRRPRPRRVRGRRAGRTRPSTLTKWLAYHYGADDAADLADRGELTLHRARATGLRRRARRARARGGGVLGAQRGRRGRARPAAQQALHFSLFTLLQASLRSEGHGVPAKGLTGTGYEGHYFWDTEAYVLPFLIHTVAGGRPQPAHAPRAHAARRPPPGRRRSAAPAPCSRGARSTARRRPPTTPPAPRSTTSTPTSPTPSTSTCGSPATPSCCSGTASSCSSRRPGCGPGSASSPSATTASSSSTRSPGPTSTPPSSTTTCSPT